MKEAVFIKRNSERWRFVEDFPSSDPDELTERFISLTDDLSYAKTFYPDSKVVLYLNGLAAQQHQQLYKNKKEEIGRVKTFWLYELPLVMLETRRNLLVSFLFFALACALGALSAANDDTFIRLIMGDDYVNLTLENIDKGDPLAIYKSSESTGMFLQITANNIRVAFHTFILGVALSVGTLYSLVQNGIMLGSFQYFFFEKGLLLESVLKIWIHGTLEISAIVIAGAAGFTVGNSLLFPGTYSRLESFRQGVKKGLKIAVGLIPIFIVAGFLESFVTRLTLPVWASCSIIGLSALFIVWYFVIYPSRIAHLSNS